LFLPNHIAKRRHKYKRGWIKLLAAFGVLLVPLWSIALFLAYKDDKQESGSPGEDRPQE
jgi:hypothetical protein